MDLILLSTFFPTTWCKRIKNRSNGSRDVAFFDLKQKRFPPCMLRAGRMGGVKDTNKVWVLANAPCCILVPLYICVWARACGYLKNYESLSSLKTQGNRVLWNSFNFFVLHTIHIYIYILPPPLNVHLLTFADHVWPFILFKKFMKILFILLWHVLSSYIF
jgi:hypothetical protein